MEIKKESLIIEPLAFHDLYDGKEEAYKQRSAQDIAKVLKEKTALRHSKSFPKIDKFYIYNPEMGIYIEFSNNELIVLLNKIFQYSKLRLPSLHLLESLSKVIRLSPEALFGDPIYDNNHLVFTNCAYDLENNVVKGWSPEIFKVSRLPYAHDENCPYEGYRVFLADNISEERGNLLTPLPDGKWSGKLAKELPGVASWVLQVNKVRELQENAKQYLINTDKMVPSLREINQESLEALNPITSWIRDEIEPGEGAFVGFTIKRDHKSDLEVKRRRTLYPTFRMWAERREITALSHRTFTSDLIVALKKEGYKDVAKTRRTEGMFIEGIRIKDLAYDRDHVYGSTLDLKDELKGQSPGGYKPPENNQQHPALTPDLYRTYMEKLGTTKMKVDLNRKVRLYFSEKGPLIEEKLKSQYFLGLENPSEAYIESLLNVLRRGIQSIAEFGAIPYSYKQMGVSPRISPISYGNTVNNVKRLIREEAYSYLGEHANREFNAKILDLDLKSCFTSIIIGLYPKELEVVQSAIETTGLWNYIKQEFINEKKEQWYNKSSVKICVYSSFFQGGGNAMIKGMMDQHQKDLGLTPKEFREFPEYERFYESSRNIAEVMQNSSIIMDLRKVSEEMKRAYMDDYLIGPTGHAYKVTDDSFRSAYSSYLQSFEFALLAETTLRVIKKNPKIEVIGHFHDGNVLIIPEGDLQESMTNLEDILTKLGYSLGLSYRQTLEVKNQWPR